jgi:DNA polymerase-3 subunit alpha
MRHGIGDQLKIDKQIIQISQLAGVKLLASNDTHYLEKKDATAHEIFMCIAMGKLFKDPNRLKHSVSEFYVKSSEQMAELFCDIPEALEASNEIADKCNLEIPLGNPTPPDYKFSKEKMGELNLSLESNKDFSTKNDDKLFKFLCEEGLKNRLKNVEQNKHEIYYARLKEEIDVISSMHFSGYMLIVWDFVDFAYSKKIPVGPGRGSAAGCLVAYVLNITNIDPIKYDLIFERFLNKERVSMPDIDMDFCQSRRGEVIEYVVDKYGKENVAQIITFNKLLAKGVIRDVARVLDMPYKEADSMSKLIPNELNINLKDAYLKEEKIRALTNINPLAKEVWDYCLILEGLNRNAGVHAAGIVVSNEPLWKKTPLFKPTGVDFIATGYSGKYIESVDLIKFDFLGLKNLTTIQIAIDLIKTKYNKVIDFDKIDINDKKVYDAICEGHTLGMFQVESSGMSVLCKQLKPDNFEYLIAILALYRPGPMESGMVSDFCERKNGDGEIDYFYDEFKEVLEPILKNTYGIIVYQEQVMRIVQDVGGFSLGGADLVRRAMGKKVQSELDGLKQQFVDGAFNKGFSKKHSSDLFDLIIKFAGYGFNKSHSAAYAMITFYTAYLKTYYAGEFLSALLAGDKDNTDKLVKYINEARRLNFEVLAPCVNRSGVDFINDTKDGKARIFFGLSAVKGVGTLAAKNMVELVKEHGEFKSLEDFLNKIDSHKINKRTLDPLIRSGGLDCFGFNRSTLVENIEQLVKVASDSDRAKGDGANSLFGDDEEVLKITINLNEIPEFKGKELLALEKESLGFYISGHPLDEYKEQINKIKHTKIEELEHINDGSYVLLIGKIDEIVTKISKKGNKFGIVTFLDFSGIIEIMMFADKLEILEKEYSIDNPLGLRVKVDKQDDGNIRLLVSEITKLDGAKNIKIRKTKKPIEAKPSIKLIIHHSDDLNLPYKVFDIISQNQGKRDISITIRTNNKDVVINSSFKVNNDIENVIQRLGDNRVYVS